MQKTKTAMLACFLFFKKSTISIECFVSVLYYVKIKFLACEKLPCQEKVRLELFPQTFKFSVWRNHLYGEEHASMWSSTSILKRTCAYSLKNTALHISKLTSVASWYAMPLIWFKFARGFGGCFVWCFKCYVPKDITQKGRCYSLEFPSANGLLSGTSSFPLSQWIVFH